MTKKEKATIITMLDLAIKGMEDAVKRDIQNMPTSYTRKSRLFNLNQGYFDGIKEFVATTDRKFYNEIVEKYGDIMGELQDKYNPIEQKIFCKVDK